MYSWVRTRPRSGRARGEQASTEAQLRRSRSHRDSSHALDAGRPYLYTRTLPSPIYVHHSCLLLDWWQNAPACLAEQMAHAIAHGWEGLVLKACQAPYIDYSDQWPHMKLKKDYISGLGDSVDLVIIGGRRDARQAHALRMEGLSWMTFYLACPVNKTTTQFGDRKVTLCVVGFVERPCTGSFGIWSTEALEKTPDANHVEIITTRSPYTFPRLGGLDEMHAGFQELPGEHIFTYCREEDTLGDQRES